ncbi:MAG: amino acid carrier protein [Synergistes sp.]|nr:amino acid carrier protein [Synergistes sp.]
MQTLFDIINAACGKIQIVSDLFWDFPTNFEWYQKLPILGNFPLAIILLIGSGIYFTFRLDFVQVRRFGYAICALKKNKSSDMGISPAAAFFLSTAMRVGPGNILGVTGAISTGGPGALFWMWVSAFFGMATAFTESTLAQIFKEENGNEYMGGMAFYGRKLMKNSAYVGVLFSLLYIIYALLCLPAQGFNTVSAVGQIAETMTGASISPNSSLYLISFALLMAVAAFASFGGIRKVTAMTDVLVPIMAVVYVLTVIVLVMTNISRIPWFFSSVFAGAFSPEAVFGGAFGVALMQGIKRGLMSNEAGQGTITIPAATADAPHPCAQGCIQSVGVFLDTMVICTLTGFIVVMGHVWTTPDAAAWFEMGKLQRYVASAAALTPQGAPFTLVSFIVSLCFGLFAFTCLLGFIAFTEISAKRISINKKFIASIRFLCLFVIAFGVLTNIAGMDLDALWNLSDFANIIMAYCNIPLLYMGFTHVLTAKRHFDLNDGTKYNSKTAGILLPVWDKKTDKE